MGKRFRSKSKNSGSRSGWKIDECRIISNGQTEIISQDDSQGQPDSDSEIIIQDYDTNDQPEIIIQDSQTEVVTQESESQILSQDFESWSCDSFDCLNEDGILSLILSSLSLKESVRTCILSSRWNGIWRYLPELHFNVENILDAETIELYESYLTGKDKCYLLFGKTDYFIQTVNSIMQQHQRHVRVDTIHIIYFLYKPHSEYLDAWVRFAVASQARVLYLDLGQPHSTFQNVELYDFPSHLLTSSSIEELYLVCCTLKPPYQCLNRLSVLTLWEVDDTGEDINHLVSHCTSLLRFDVVGSKELGSLNIPHSLSKLHSLTVENCDRLTKINVNAENVGEFFYEGVPVDFTLRQPSYLVKAKICFKTEGSDHNLNFYLTKLAKDLPYLRFLTLKINGVLKVESWSKCSPRFIHLKLLDWEWSEGVKMSHLHLDTLLDAAPFLEELKLRLSTCGVEKPPPRLTELKKRIKKKFLKHAQSHLKIIEISGFYFERWQVEIVMYLLINATNLDSMTLILDKGRNPVKKTDMYILAQQVPPNVKLVIL